MKRFLISLSVAIASYLSASSAHATLSGSPPPQPPVASGCRVTVYSYFDPSKAASGKTTLSQQECSAINAPTYAGANRGINFMAYGSDGLTDLTTSRVFPPNLGDPEIYYQGISLNSAREILSLATLVSNVNNSGIRAQGDWFGSSGAFSPPPPVMCQPETINFGNGCVYQTQSPVVAGTAVQANSTSAGYVGSVTATCNNAGKFEYVGFTCTKTYVAPPPPPPPPAVVQPVYNWWDFSYFWW